jgi:hypothetical protein
MSGSEVSSLNCSRQIQSSDVAQPTHACPLHFVTSSIPYYTHLWNVTCSMKHEENTVVNDASMYLAKCDVKACRWEISGGGTHLKEMV